MRLHRRRGERGQALVEFCLLTPVLLLFVLLTVDVGRAYFQAVDAAGAARAGAAAGWELEPRPTGAGRHQVLSGHTGPVGDRAGRLAVPASVGDRRRALLLVPARSLSKPSERDLTLRGLERPDCRNTRRRWPSSVGEEIARE
ncbi:MAG: hypothetical protein E6J05_00065 [Chloroflexi bacterium]|nr:MAG: hypothetical protein E6J05_00065 [Chloroflexota bacterium]